MSLFETRDLVVSSAPIDQCFNTSKIVYFIDLKNGKGVASGDNFDKACTYAISYQSQLDSLVEVGL